MCSLSKLSDFVKNERAKDLESKPLKDYLLESQEYNEKFLKCLYDKISNLEFESYKTDSAYYLEIKNVVHYDKIIVKIPFGKTVYYEIANFPKDSTIEQCILLNNYDLKLDIIGCDNKFIDTQEILYYCGKTAKEVVQAKSTLNKEIDNGFKNPTPTKDIMKDMFGKDSLDEDVKFNEWMHKKVR